MRSNHIKKSWIIILIILSVSFFLRLALAYHWRDSFFKRGNRYSLLIPLAENILKGKYSVDGEYPNITQEPLYPLFLAGILRIFSKSYFWLGVAIFQGLLAIFSSVMIYFIGKNLFNNNVGLLSCIIAVFYPFPLIQSISIADTTIFIFMLTFLVYTFIKVIQQGIPIYFSILCGCAITLALLTRDATIIFIPFLIIYLFLNLSKKDAFKKALIILTSTAIFLFPWLIRNYKLTSSFIISAHGTGALWTGTEPLIWNYIQNDVTFDELYRTDNPPEIWQKYPLNKIKNPKKLVEAGRIYNAEALKNIKRNPVMFIKMLWIKFVKFWSWELYPPPNNPAFIEGKLRSFGYALSYIPFLFLGIIGIIFSLSKWKKLSILYFIFLSFSLTYMLTFPLTRYRIPSDIFLIIFASHSINICYSKLRKAASITIL